MSVIVRDAGFAAEGLNAGFVTLEEFDGIGAVDLTSDTERDALAGLLGASAIRIDFPSFADGRGFGLARALRSLGYAGRLRAKGHVIADQYLNARLSGFDEVEISDELAERQPEAQWVARAGRISSNYQARLRGVA